MILDEKKLVEQGFTPEQRDALQKQALEMKAKGIEMEVSGEIEVGAVSGEKSSKGKGKKK